MGIDYFHLLGDEGWIPLQIDPSDPQHRWAPGGGSLAQAPVDVAATFDGAMWCSTKVDRSFNLAALRCRPDFVVPRHHCNLRRLIIVIGGEVGVEHGGDDGDPIARRRVGPGQFFVSDAGTPFTMTAGSGGATYVETWPRPVAELETYWHEEGWVRAGATNGAR